MSQIYSKECRNQVLFGADLRTYPALLPHAAHQVQFTIFDGEMVHREGFEPSAPRFVVWCSIQLSYRCIAGPTGGKVGIPNAMAGRMQAVIGAFFQEMLRLLNCAVSCRILPPARWLAGWFPAWFRGWFPGWFRLPFRGLPNPLSRGEWAGVR